MRDLFQITITNSILNYVTYGEVQRGWIDNNLLIFTRLNINIGTAVSSLSPIL